MKKLGIILLFTVLLSSAAFSLQRPDKLYGLYISWWTMHYPERLNEILNKAKEYQFNTLVCDFRGPVDAVYRQNFLAAQKKDYYLIARVVVFEEGVGASFASAQDQSLWQKKKLVIKDAEKLGFNEIQLDYIRFADAGAADPRKKEIIESIVKDAQDSVDIPLGVDVFGSVAYQPHLLIGQDLARMAQYIEAVSPMLYPSHFLKDRIRMGHPYETMLEGSYMAKKKIVGKPVRLVPFIQGFPMNMSYYGKDLKSYIKDQIQAVEDAGTDGFFVWHAGNDYRTTFEAVREHGPFFNNQPLDLQELRKRISILSVPGNLLSADVENTSAAEPSRQESKTIFSLLTFGML